jgi:hypothetical protein
MALPYRFSAVLDKRMTFTEYRYSTEDEDFDNSYKFKSSWDKEHLEYVAEDAAEHHHRDGGWEDEWPLDFKIWLEDGTILGTFTVDMEYEPRFSARIVKCLE